VSDAGEEIVLAPGADDLAKLASWVDVVSIERFVARIDLERLSATRFRYRAEIEAELTQTCVVTLEPLHTRVERGFERELLLTPRPRARTETDIVTPAEDDTPEEIASPHFDVAGPVLEEFSLAIDPYPRRADAAFAPPADEEAGPANPFAVLKGLKTGL
jgi:uncharacterized metal-binding protein YceD (DUF177 family)